MKKLYIAIVLSFVWMSIGAVAQEHKHDEHKEEKPAPVNKAAEPAKSDLMKCCEGMEKMGEIKAGMPIKDDVTKEMKAKMMEKMKMKTAEKLPEKYSQDAPFKNQAEKNQPSNDTHQH